MTTLAELTELSVRLPSILPDNLFELKSSRPADCNCVFCTDRYRRLGWIDSASLIDIPAVVADVLITVVLCVLLHRGRSNIRR